jgi:hypothetical protein
VAFHHFTFLASNPDEDFQWFLSQLAVGGVGQLCRAVFFLNCARWFYRPIRRHSLKYNFVGLIVVLLFHTSTVHG